MRIVHVNSGGQTGADRAGLDAAMEAGVPHGGYCPCGRRAEDGVIPERYSLKETGSLGYAKRTEMNVLISNATVVFTRGKMGPGSVKTLHIARMLGKPVLHIDVLDKDAEATASTVLEWLRGLDLENVVLNVAGSRESSSPGIGLQVRGIMLRVLRS